MRCPAREDNAKDDDEDTDEDEEDATSLARACRGTSPSAACAA
jgi:hypothetical protein